MCTCYGTIQATAVLLTSCSTCKFEFQGMTIGPLVGHEPAGKGAVRVTRCMVVLRCVRHRGPHPPVRKSRKRWFRRAKIDLFLILFPKYSNPLTQCKLTVTGSEELQLFPANTCSFKYIFLRYIISDNCTLNSEQYKLVCVLLPYTSRTRT